MRHIRYYSACVGAILLVMASGAAFGELDSAGQGNAKSLKDSDPGGNKIFEQAKVYMQKMQGSLRRSIKQREEAERQKDLIKLNCLNEKLAQSDSHQKEADQALSALSDAVVRNDTAERTHEYNRIRLFYQKVLVLSAEADNCAGEDAGYVGPSQIEVEVDPTIPQGDPTDPGLPTPNFTMAPPGIEQAAADSPSTPPSG